MSQDVDTDTGETSADSETSLGGLPSGYDESVGRRDSEIGELRVAYDSDELFFDQMYSKRSHLARLHTTQLQARVFDHSGRTSMQMSATSDNDETTGIVRVTSHDSGGSTAGAVTVDFELLSVAADGMPLLNGTTDMAGLLELRPDEARRLIEALVDGHNEIASGVDVTVDLVADETDDGDDDTVDTDDDTVDTDDDTVDTDDDPGTLDLTARNARKEASLSLLRDATEL